MDIHTESYDTASSVGSTTAPTARRKEEGATRCVLEQAVGGLACVSEDERPGDDIVSCEDRVSLASGWRRRPHLDRLRKGPDRVLAENDTHAVPEGKFECVDGGGGGHTEGGWDGVGACGVKDAGDGLRRAWRAEFLRVRIRNGSSEQQRAYQE